MAERVARQPRFDLLPDRGIAVDVPGEVERRAGAAQLPGAVMQEMLVARSPDAGANRLGHIRVACQVQLLGEPRQRIGGVGRGQVVAQRAARSRLRVAGSVPGRVEPGRGCRLRPAGGLPVQIPGETSARRGRRRGVRRKLRQQPGGIEEQAAGAAFPVARAQVVVEAVGEVASGQRLRRQVLVAGAIQRFVEQPVRRDLAPPGAAIGVEGGFRPPVPDRGGDGRMRRAHPGFVEPQVGGQAGRLAVIEVVAQRRRRVPRRGVRAVGRVESGVEHRPGDQGLSGQAQHLPRRPGRCGDARGRRGLVYRRRSLNTTPEACRSAISSGVNAVLGQHLGPVRAERGRRGAGAARGARQLDRRAEAAVPVELRHHVPVRGVRRGGRLVHRTAPARPARRRGSASARSPARPPPRTRLSAPRSARRG